MNDTTTTQTDPPGAPAHAPALVRPRDDRVIAGVASGLARRLGIGTGWVRAAFVIATLIGGSGLLLYIIGWLAIPEEGEGESIAAAKVADLEGSSRWIGVALIVIGVLLVLSWTDVVRGELVWAGALVLLGVLLYRGELPSPQRRERAVAPPPPLPPPPAVSAMPEGADAVAASAVVSEEAPEEAPAELSPSPPDAGRVAVAPPLPPAGVNAPEPPQRRSFLGRITLAAVLIAVGVLAILDNAGVVAPAARHYVGAVVAVVGLGLIAGAWFGRSRALIAVGILLLPVLLVSSVVRVPLVNEFGDKVFAPATTGSIADAYRLGAGDLTVDLSHLEMDEGIVDVEATVGAGRLTVIIPADAWVSVDGRIGFGELRVLGVTRDGVGREVNLAPPAGASSYLDLEVEVGFGQVRVVRAAS